MSANVTPAEARRPIRRRLALVVLAAALLTGSVAAMPRAAAGSPAELHCVVQVVDQSPEGELATELLGCSSTFAGAMALASGGSLELAPDTAGSVVFTDAAVAEAVLSFTLGIHYDGYNGSGSSVTVVGSGCTGGYWNTPSWFDNRISSSYHGCYRLVHYDNPDLGGMSKTTVGVGGTYNLTLFNNRTESVRYLGS